MMSWYYTKSVSMAWDGVTDQRRNLFSKSSLQTCFSQLWENKSAPEGKRLMLNKRIKEGER